MKKQKTLLVLKSTRLNKENLYNLSKLPYSKIVVFYNLKSKKEIKIPLKIQTILYENIKDLNKKLTQINKDYSEYEIIPFFIGDSNSKYSIKVLNQSYNTKIDPAIFKQKDKMVKFLGEIAQKKYIKLSHKELIKKNYNEIKDIVGERFIVKPTDASSSTNTFKVRDMDNFEDIKLKISKTYDYMIEEYISGNLFSIDFFFDGENIFLLVYAREIAMIELAEKNKFSPGFLKKYGEELNKHFNFILPLGYHIDFSKLSKTELDLLENIKEKLKKNGYKGAIHLEYKFEPETKKIGFIEWGARYGGYRTMFMKKIYNTDSYRLPYYILIEKDFSRFSKIKGNIYKFKEKEFNLNFIRVKTNFIDKTNYIEILKKSQNIFENSFSGFLKNYYKTNFGVNIKKIDFFVTYNKDYNFFPFYKNNETKLDYVLELDDENFSLFKKKKFKIIEEIFFHDYKKF